MQVYVGDWDYPHARQFHVSLPQSLANHYKPLPSSEWVVEGVAVLGAADNYNEFVNLAENFLYGVKVADVEGLESANVESAVYQDYYRSQLSPRRLISFTTVISG